jgi:hypothetical protein
MPRRLHYSFWAALPILPLALLVLATVALIHGTAKIIATLLVR